jgi:hypothetical protein
MPWVQLGYQALLSSRVNVAVTNAEYLDLGLAEMLTTHAGILYYYNLLVPPASFKEVVANLFFLDRRIGAFHSHYRANP